MGYFINSYIARNVINDEKYNEVENFKKFCGILFIEIILIEVFKYYFDNLYSIFLFIIFIIPSFLIISGKMKILNFEQLLRDIKKIKK